MIIKDISNKDIASLKSCDLEPIHIPGSIQAHGVLLAIDDLHRIRFCSANCQRAVGQEPAAVLHQLLSAVSADLAAVVDQYSSTGPNKPTLLHLHGQNWDVSIHRNDAFLIIELEDYQPGSYNDQDLFDQTTQFVSFIERSKSLQELCQRIAEGTRKRTGYDRVMIYRFDKENNGQVFAESRREDLEPFLNLHYPHTDIPVQARELYLRNLMRMIVDVHYTPVPLLASADEKTPQLDLSDALLRSVSPIHIQYLKNMGVASSMSVSLVLEGRLWGLISCHHCTPLHLSFSQRRAALLQGHFLTSQIKVRQVAEEYEVNIVVEAHLQQLLNIIGQDGDFPIKFASMTSLLSLVNATGVLLMHKGQLYEKGMVPPRERTRQLVQWLADNVKGLQFSTAHLHSYYPDAEKISRAAAGILYHRLGDPNKDCIIWFREEIEKSINWAGNPYEASNSKQSTGNQLVPRSSFATYRESVRFQSHDWRTSEINAAARFATTLQNQFHLEYLRTEEAHQRMLNEKLQNANNELSNINWITSHDLKEPLRKIMLFASRIMTEEERELSESLVNSINKIQSSAQRMQTLVDDIISYSLTDNRNASFVTTDLNTLLSEVLAQYADDFREKKITYEAGPLPTLRVIPYQIRQLFYNLIGNSIKFARLEPPLHIGIQATTVAGDPSIHALLRTGEEYARIEVRDNGIGFTAEQGIKIFDIFYRLHDRSTYPGTGIGLAICKRIVENHGGVITATGQKDKGASFVIFLPKAID